jgi:NodT family efflux transporter outer membrane factor (OMF) lipoprotein
MISTNTALTQITPWLVLLLVGVGCADRSVRAPLPQLPAMEEFTVTGNTTQLDRWWIVFGDSQLDVHVATGLTSNFSLQAAAHRIRAARAVTRREASDFWPDIDGILGLGSRMGPGENVPSYNLGLDANWQVDLWGEIESRVEAQRLRANATCWDYHSGALALSGEVTSVWFALIEAYAQTELLKVQIKTNWIGAKLQEERFGRGLVRAADVLRQRQLLESTREQAVVVESQIKVLEHQLAVLLGQMPQSASFELEPTFPELPPLPKTGLPAELLLRRPDIQRNYSALAAADADLASAVSRLYPRLNLSGSLQNITEHPEDLLKDWFATLAGQLIAPLFDGGQRRAEVDRSAAVKLVLFNEYAQSVLLAFQQVEDALVQEKFQIQRIEHIEEQVKLAEQSSEQLRQQYLIGDAQYLDVLNAITGQQRLQRQLLRAQLDLRLIRVTLYLALAGNIDPNCVGEGFTDTELLPLENVDRPTLESGNENIENPKNREPASTESTRRRSSRRSEDDEIDLSFITDDEPNLGNDSDMLNFSELKNRFLETPLPDRLSGTTDDE